MDYDSAETKTSASVGTTQVLTSLLLIAAAWSVLSFKWKQRKLEKAASKLPGPPALPILGNALEFWGKPEDMYHSLYELIKQYESPARFWMGSTLIIHVGKPQDIQIVLNSRHALGKPTLYRFLKEWIPTGLITSSVEVWRGHRRVIEPAFNAKVMEQFMPIFSKYSGQLVDKLKPHVNNSCHVDICDYLTTHGLDIICEAALGVDETVSKSEFANASKRLLDLILYRTYRLWLYPYVVFYIMMVLQYGYNLQNYLTQMCNRLPDTIIKQKREEFKLKKERAATSAPNSETVGEQKSKVFIDILIQLSDGDTNFSDEEVRDEIVTMIIAGHESTALTLGFCTLMLAIHQDVQEKVYEEIFAISGNSDHQVTMEDVKQMKYTEMVIKETLRIFPPPPIILRYLTQDIDLTEHRLPAGCIIAISPLALHKDPKIYPNAENFDPENFTPEKIAGRHKYSYLPFSGGPRNCFGKIFSMLSLKSTLSTLVRNYRFYTDVKIEDIKLKMDAILRPTSGFPVRIVKRM